MTAATNGSNASSRNILAGAAVLITCGTLWSLACGGTTGREGLPVPSTDAGQDVSALPDAKGPELDARTFDIAIVYADRDLPDVEMPDAASDATTTGDATATMEAGLAPCTAQNPTNCVQCQGNVPTDGGPAAGLCTPTEADFVQHDIDTHHATEAGTDPDDSCYSCLLANGGLDDTEYGDTGNECEDGAPFAGAGMTTSAECQSVIRCILGSSCALSPEVPACYCGDAGPLTTCNGNPAPGPINGACASGIAVGLGFQPNDGTDILKNFEDTSKAAGRAFAIFQSAKSENCTACLQ